MPEHAIAILKTAFRRFDQPGRVLESHRLRHDEVMTHTERRRFRIAQVFARRVEAEGDHLGALERKHAECLGPAPVIADQHAGNGVHETPDAKPQVADFEIFFLQVLESSFRLMVRMAGEVDFAVLAYDGTIRTDQDRGVEAARAAFLRSELRTPDIEPYAELLRFLEKRLCFRGRHRGLEEPAVDFIEVFVPMAWKKRRKREFGKHHELRTHAMGLAQ